MSVSRVSDLDLVRKKVKKLSKKQARDMLRRVLGEWRVVDLSREEASDLWKILKDRKPYYSSHSLHVIEDRYRYKKKIYHVMWSIGHPQAQVPMWVGIRVPYNWDDK